MIDVFFGLRPMIERQVTLLPQPDSPTMPSVLPFSTEKLTPSTALTMPSSVRKYVLRSFTSSSAIWPPGYLREPDPRIDPGVDEIDQQIEGHDAERREHDDALRRREIRRGEALHGRPPEAGQAEHRLREDRS